MFRGRFFVSTLFSILLIGLLVAGGYALIRLGWSQGYAMGLQAAQGEALPSAPFVPYPRYGLGFGFLPFLCGFGLLLFFGLFLMRFFWFGRACRAWHKAGWPQGEDWPKPWGHGRMPPWYQPSKEMPEGQPEEAESEPDEA